MRRRIIYILLITIGIAFSVQLIEPAFAFSKKSEQASEQMKKKKKRKKPKKKKPAKNKTQKTSKKKTLTKQDSVKIARKKKKTDKRHEKNQGKLDKKREEKAKTVKKAQEDRKDYDKCDSADVLRTSTDTALLAKYIKIYRTLGGICYIIHLQKMAELDQSAEGFYSVQMTNSKDPRAPAAWQTYLYCPIGKPNGTVALMSPEGDTIQMCSYQNEMKNGMMYYVKKGKGVIYKEKYVNDVKVWEKKEDE